VLDAVGRLREAAGDPSLTQRTLRVGTVNAGTSSVLVPAIHDFRRRHPGTLVELMALQAAEVTRGLVEGSLDLGLVNVLPGDDVTPELDATPLVHGRPVVVCRNDHPFAEMEAVPLADLEHEPFIAMRSGYLMHRFAHRVFAGRLPVTWYSTDGAELGKLMVAEGLGVTILPDYSVDEDPLAVSGRIVHRPLAGDETTVQMLVLHRRTTRPAAALAGLRDALVAQASAMMGACPNQPRTASPS
jgi:DNA-binding transcriptional LysR family regulator